MLLVLNFLLSLCLSGRLCNIRVETDNGPSAKYNLSPYVLDFLSSKPYHCINSIGTSKDYSYCFNLCLPVSEYPVGSNWFPNGTSCLSNNLGARGGYCPEGKYCSNPDTLINITGKAWAYQIINTPKNENERVCYRLSDEYGGKPPEWSFIDKDDITAGVQILYKNGDYAGWDCYKNRQFKMQFKCSNERYNIPKSELVKETKCVYEVSFTSIYGCPTECVSGFSMCNGRGICGYDYTSNMAKCFCYGEYSGNYCSELNDLGYSPKSKEIPNNLLVKQWNMDYIGNNMNGDEYHSNINIVYNLEPFQVSNYGHWFINDSKNGIDGYYYYLNIGNDGYGINMDMLPEKCQLVGGYCDEDDYNITTEYCNIQPANYSGNGMAYQYDIKYDNCVLLGKNPIFELIDNVTDYAKGVKISLTTGTYAPGCQTENKNRELIINLRCPNSNYGYNWNKTSTTEIELPVTVAEDGLNCDYAFTLEHALACPYNCITYNPNNTNIISVCSGRGRCVADPYVKFVRCICDDGYTGDNCETEIRTISNSPTIKPTKNPIPCPTSNITVTIVNNEQQSNNGNLKELNSWKISTIILAILVLLLILCIIIKMWNEKRKRVQFGTQLGSERPVNRRKLGGDTEMGNTRLADDSD